MEKAGVTLEIFVILGSEKVVMMEVEVLICPEKMPDSLSAATAKTMVLWSRYIR
jgi:hypothetical protein